MTYITDISRQTVTIDGTAYTSDEATAHGAPSQLQTLFRRKYGEGSFHASLADFLAEWFDGSDTLTVHTSGSTGTPKELRAEKRRMMNSAVMTLSFLRLKPGDTALLCMPLQYIAGKMVAVRALVGGLNLIPKTPGGHPLKGMAEAPDFAAMIPMQVFNSLAVAEEKKLLRYAADALNGLYSALGGGRKISGTEQFGSSGVRRALKKTFLLCNDASMKICMLAESSGGDALLSGFARTAMCVSQSVLAVYVMQL